MIAIRTTKQVPYHGEEWLHLVESGWITVVVSFASNRQAYALMMYCGKGNFNMTPLEETYIRLARFNHRQLRAVRYLISCYGFTIHQAARLIAHIHA